MTDEAASKMCEAPFAKPIHAIKSWLPLVCATVLPVFFKTPQNTHGWSAADNESSSKT